MGLENLEKLHSWKLTILNFYMVHLLIRFLQNNNFNHLNGLALSLGKVN